MPGVEISETRQGRVEVTTNYVDRFLIKELPGANYDGQVWHAPCTWATCVILRGLFGDQLDVGPNLMEWSWNEYQTRIEPAMKLRMALKIPDEFMDTEAARTIISWRGTRKHDLREFQEAGVLYLYVAGSAGLLDPMGSGKTTQLINLLRLRRELGEDPYPALIVPPNTVKATWKREFALWDPEVGVQIISDNAAQRCKQLATVADVYVINWESLRLHSRLAGYGSYALRGCRVCDLDLLRVHDAALEKLNDLKQLLEKIKQAREDDPEVEQALKDDQRYNDLLEHLPVLEKSYRDAKRNSSHTTCEVCPRELNAVKWRTVVADEAHRARYPKSKQTRALWAVSKCATWNLWATGTPLSDSVDDLWSPLHFMAPAEWPAKTRYLDRFAEKKFNMWGGMDILGIREDTKREFFQILEPRYRRLPKEIILPHLPPKVHMPPYLTEMNAKQSRAYKQMLKHMMTELDDGSLLAAPNPLVRTTRLLQFASAYAEINTDGHVVMASPSCKIDAMEQVIEELETEQIVFFAENELLIRLAAERLEKMKIKYGLITGPTALDVRAFNEELFQTGDLQVILATMGAGREGITLTAAPVLVRMQRSWRTEFNQQAEDRVHRIGSEIHEVVRIIDFVTAGTIEDSQIAVLEGKYSRQQEVVRDKETMRSILLGEFNGT